MSDKDSTSLCQVCTKNSEALKQRLVGMMERYEELYITAKEHDGIIIAVVGSVDQHEKILQDLSKRVRRLEIKEAQSLANQGKYDLAIEIYKNALKYNNDPRFWLLLGWAYLCQGDKEKSLEVTKKVMEESTEGKIRSQAIELETHIYHKLYTYKEFRSYLKRVNDSGFSGFTETDKTVFLNNSAWILYEYHDLFDALELTEEAIKYASDAVHSYDTRACILAALGKDSEALKSFEKARELKKMDNQITWSILSKLYAKLGMQEEATEAEKIGKTVDGEAPNDDPVF
ncbi:MAG: tetratricopeptide repeat protein [Nitrososphaerota archaeon]|jgi:tetratricopeptide (TPR) repeat protein|nr:tetratricopeptide repeat protein [Nitrososphaerota archaeon]